ncbi:MAG: hypothetical protein QXY40_05205 [Candidatus Methanomethylicia archaeon]
MVSSNYNTFIVWVFFENPIYGVLEFEVYMAEASLYNGLREVSIGEVKVYIPVEPEFITDEVLLGREIINGKIKFLALNNLERNLSIEI